MTAREIGWAQIALSFSFVGGYFVILGIFLLGYVRVPLDYKDAFMTLLGVVTGSVGTVISYWFSRQRPDTPRPTPTQP